MTSVLPEAETVLEVCVVAFTASLVVALAVVIVGGRSGRTHQRRQQSAPPPEGGVVARERHRHILGVAAR